ncbi:recombinase family protein [Actinomadura geliboluensis]|uniref:recombinase family protein n=1 Tax=Actinomadura geliboluensis TaxID=882440 RepID=UPI0036ADC46E
MPLIIRPSRSEPHGQARRTPRRPAAGRLARLEYARPGDTLVLPSLDRLSRAAQGLIIIVTGLRARAASGSAALHEASDTTMPGGRLVFQGLDAARALLTRPDESVSSIARLLGHLRAAPAPFRCPPSRQRSGLGQRLIAISRDGPSA